MSQGGQVLNLNHAFDLITDDELHHEGAGLLANYKTVVTGSHPEYHTPQMLDGLQARAIA